MCPTPGWEQPKVERSKADAGGTPGTDGPRKEGFLPVLNPAGYSKLLVVSSSLAGWQRFQLLL